MRTKMVLLGLVLMVTGLMVNLFMGYDEVEVSDYDIAMMHVEKVYGEGNYDVIICEDTDDDYIHYECYEDENLRYDTYIYRDASYDCLTGKYDEVHD